MQAGAPKFGVLLLEEDAGHFCELARRADRAGVTSIWTIEYYNRNSLARLAMMAACTERTTVGTAITAAFARAPLMTATAAADVVALAPGRVVLGLGSSTRRMNTDWYGVDASHPAPRIEELVELLKAIWAHENGPFGFDGTFYNLTFAHLDKLPTDPPPPIYTAGVNERMVRTAGRVADGFIGHPLATPTYFKEVARGAVARGASEAGRDAGAVHMATQVIVAPDEDLAAARRRVALQVAFYSTVKTYDIFFELHGFQEERALIQAAFLKHDTEGMLGAVSERMLDEMAVYGPPKRIWSGLERFTGVVDTAILYPPHFGSSQQQMRQDHYGLIDMLAKVA
jgi:probable F420-dependent oxidoreductase